MGEEQEEGDALTRDDKIMLVIAGVTVVLVMALILYLALKLGMR